MIIALDFEFPWTFQKTHTSVILFIYCLYNNTVISIGYIVMNDKMIIEYGIGKDVEGSRHGLI